MCYSKLLSHITQWVLKCLKSTRPFFFFWMMIDKLLNLYFTPEVDLCTKNELLDRKPMKSPVCSWSFCSFSAFFSRSINSETALTSVVKQTIQTALTALPCWLQIESYNSFPFYAASILLRPRYIYFHHVLFTLPRLTHLHWVQPSLINVISCVCAFPTRKKTKSLFTHATCSCVVLVVNMSEVMLPSSFKSKKLMITNGTFIKRLLFLLHSFFFLFLWLNLFY